MDAVRDEATRIFESFAEMKPNSSRPATIRQFLDKAFTSGANLRRPKESNNEEAGLIVNPPKDALLGATRGDLADAELVSSCVHSNTHSILGLPINKTLEVLHLVLLLEEMERNQATKPVCVKR